MDSVYFRSDSTTYIKEDGTNLLFYVKGTKALTVESDGGILHGAWNAQAAITTSDRRLKREIAPLQRTLRNIIPQMAEQSKEQRGKVENRLTTKGASDDSGTDGALWLLRQLRPVSYSFRKGAESKYMRFGFIADELESVVPQVVRTVGNREVEDQKAVVYQDLIALLASAAQSQQQRLDQQQQRLDQQQQQLDQQHLLTKELQKTLSSVQGELEQLKGAKQEEKKKTRLSFRSGRRRTQRRT